MTPVTSFLPRILPYVTGCPEPLAKQAILDAAIAFCEESLVLRQRLSDMTSAAGTAEYTITYPSSDEQVARVLNVWVDGQIMGAVAADESGTVNTAQAKPSSFYMTRPDSVMTLNLYPIPDGAYTIVTEVALRPTRNAQYLQDDLLVFWVEAVTQGALGRLMMTPQQPFSDPADGQTRLLFARNEARKARVDGRLGKLSSTVRVQPRAFA